MCILPLISHALPPPILSDTRSTATRHICRQDWGVDLYGGTRHSTATALREHFTPEQIKRATMHSTNQAFERHFQTDGEDLRKIYAAQGDKAVPFMRSAESTEFGDTVGTRKRRISGTSLHRNRLKLNGIDMRKLVEETGVEPVSRNLRSELLQA